MLGHPGGKKPREPATRSLQENVNSLLSSKPVKATITDLCIIQKSLVWHWTDGAIITLLFLHM